MRCGSIHLVLLSCAVTLFYLTAGNAQETKPNIALSDFAGQGIDASTVATISDRMRAELFSTGKVTVLERSQMVQILKEQGFQQSGCTSDQCAVEMGQMIGVKYMVVGSIGLVGRTYTIASRLIDVATGKMVAAANTDCKCEIDDLLSKSTVDIAAKLVKSFENDQQSLSQKVAVASTGQSVEVAPAKKRSRIGLWPKVALGAGAIVAAGVGLLCDAGVKGEVNKTADISAQYLQTGSNVRLPGLRA